MNSKILNLMVLTSSLFFHATSASVSMTCESILGSDPNSLNKEIYQPSLTVRTFDHKLSVLMFHLTDITNTNINVFDLESLVDEENKRSFICTEHRTTIGDCSIDKLGKFVFETEGKLNDEIVNLELKPNQYLSYNVTETGSYCAIVYSPSDSKDYSITSMQSYGHLRLDEHEHMKFLAKFVLPFSFVVLLVSIFHYFKKFQDKRQHQQLDLTLMVFALVVFLFKSTEFICLHLMNHHDNFSSDGTSKLVISSVVTSIMITLHGMFLVQLLVIFYGLSVGYFGILTTKRLRKPSLKFRIGLSIYLFVNIYGLLNELAGLPGLSGVLKLSGFVSLMFLIYWIKIQSLETLNKFENISDKRNYKVTRMITLLLPIFLFIISFGLTGYLSLKYAMSISSIDKSNLNSMVDPTGELFLKTFEKTSLNTLILQPMFIMDFAYPLLACCYLVFWWNSAPVLNTNTAGHFVDNEPSEEARFTEEAGDIIQTEKQTV